MLVVGLVCEVIHGRSMPDMAVLDCSRLLENVERAVDGGDVNVYTTLGAYCLVDCHRCEMLAVAVSDDCAHQTARFGDPETFLAENVGQVVRGDVHAGPPG